MADVRQRNPVEMRALIDIKEASRLLGDVPVKTLYEWRSRGDGPPSFRVGRHVRYRPEAIEAWLQSLETNA